MAKIALWILGITFLAGGIFSMVMLVVAAQFMEYGRVIFYLTIAIICMEAAVITFMKLRNLSKKKS